MEQIAVQLEDDFGSVCYDAFLTFLREITEDTTSPEQLLEAFQGLAGDKPYVTEVDLREAMLPAGSVEYFKREMPEVGGEDAERREQLGLATGQGNGAGSAGGGEKVYDYEAYLHGLFWSAQRAGAGGHEADNSMVYGHDADTSIM